MKNNLLNGWERIVIELDIVRIIRRKEDGELVKCLLCMIMIVRKLLMVFIIIESGRNI